MSIVRFLQGWWRTLRLSVYLLCVFVILSVLAGRSLYAHVKDAARALGRELHGLSALTKGAETVRVNGATFHHAALTVEQSVSTVLDEVEVHCQKSTGLFASTMRELESRHRGMLDQYPELGGLRRGVFRDESESGGTLVCFVGKGQSGLKGLIRAAERFMATSDLSEFGFVRYATAERTKDGRTRVAVLWTDEELSMSKMFPATGDAAGSDSRELPRPPNARRTLTAAAEGMPFALRLYESRDRRASLGSLYERWMTEHGWTVAAKEAQRDTVAYHHRDGRQVFVSLSEANARTYVTLLEAGRSDATSLAAAELVE